MGLYEGQKAAISAFLSALPRRRLDTNTTCYKVKPAPRVSEPSRVPAPTPPPGYQPPRGARESASRPGRSPAAESARELSGESPPTSREFFPSAGTERTLCLRSPLPSRPNASLSPKPPPALKSVTTSFRVSWKYRKASLVPQRSLSPLASGFPLSGRPARQKG